MTESYENDVRNLRKAKKLHSVVKRRLVRLLRMAFPDSAAVPEVSAIPGGRNDLLQYFYDGRRIVMEIFCSSSQVPQDLRLLEQCAAAVRIAVLLDREVDDSVATNYFRKKPDAFPYLWLRHVLDESWTAITVARLRELIDENHSVAQLRRLMTSKHGAAIDRTIRNILRQVESKIAGRRERAIPRLTGRHVLALYILSPIKKMSVPIERLQSLYHWLVASVDYAIDIVSCGMQAFLVTDLESRHAIWSDGDLADDLIICSSQLSEARVVICLNPIVNDFLVKNGLKKPKLRFHFFHSYEEYIERIVSKTRTGRK